jgi:hypothetical protein
MGETELNVADDIRIFDIFITVRPVLDGWVVGMVVLAG